jgi:hypothetical protein
VTLTEEVCVSDRGNPRTDFQKPRDDIGKRQRLVDSFLEVFNYFLRVYLLDCPPVGNIRKNLIHPRFGALDYFHSLRSLSRGPCRVALRLPSYTANRSLADKLGPPRRKKRIAVGTEFYRKNGMTSMQALCHGDRAFDTSTRPNNFFAKFHCHLE